MSANREERKDATEGVWPAVHGDGFSVTVKTEVPHRARPEGAPGKDVGAPLPKRSPNT